MTASVNRDCGPRSAGHMQYGWLRPVELPQLRGEFHCLVRSQGRVRLGPENIRTARLTSLIGMQPEWQVQMHYIPFRLRCSATARLRVYLVWWKIRFLPSCGALHGSLLWFARSESTGMSSTLVCMVPVGRSALASWRRCTYPVCYASVMPVICIDPGG